jgi:hypothetical protein
MKLKLIAAAALFAFAAPGVHAADKMDCCKEGKCACCAPKKDEPKPDKHEGMKH